MREASLTVTDTKTHITPVFCFNNSLSVTDQQSASDPTAPPDPAKPPTPAKPSAGAEEIEPSVGTGEPSAGAGKEKAYDGEEKVRDMEGDRRELADRDKIGATNSREVNAADGSGLGGSSLQSAAAGASKAYSGKDPS